MRLRRGSRQAGFALVAVIWGLGLATLLGSAAIIGSRHRLKDVDRLVDIAEASSGAESALVFGIRKAMDGDPLYLSRKPVSCVFPDQAFVTLLITPESGKIDLNSARPELLARLFVALTGDPRRGALLAQALVQVRAKAKDALRSGSTSGANDDTDHPPLRTVLELDRVPGMTTALLYRALPFITVASGKAEFDTKTAAPALLALLDLPPDPATADPAAIDGVVTIHAVLRTIAGTWAVRDALVEIGPNNAYAIREWRVGRRDAETDPAGPDGSEDACLS